MCPFVGYDHARSARAGAGLVSPKEQTQHLQPGIHSVRRNRLNAHHRGQHLVDERGEFPVERSQKGTIAPELRNQSVSASRLRPRILPQIKPADGRRRDHHEEQKPQ